MTRKILKILLLVISISYGLWLVYNQLFPGINSIHGQVVYIEDVSKLEDLAEDIIRVKPIGKKKQMINFSGKTFTWGYTITQVEILKAYKAANLKEKDIVSVIEPYCYYTYPIIGLKQLVTFNSYKPMERKKEYILFLHSYEGNDKNRIGKYELTSGLYGKYVVLNGEKVDVNKLSLDSLGLYEEISRYRDFYKDIIEKY